MVESIETQLNLRNVHSFSLKNDNNTLYVNNPKIYIRDRSATNNLITIIDNKINLKIFSQMHVKDNKEFKYIDDLFIKMLVFMQNSFKIIIRIEDKNFIFNKTELTEWRKEGDYDTFYYKIYITGNLKQGG